MESLLPSEIARLVYGYLKDEQCYEAAEKFLETSPHLSECQKIAKQGRRFHTRVLGRSLVEMCDVFSTVYSVVQERIENSQDIATNSALFNQFQLLLNANCSSKQNICSNVTTIIAPSSKEDEVDGRYVGSSVLKPHATSTPYSNALTNVSYGDRHAAPSSSAANNSVRRQLLSEKENERAVNNNEVLQVYIDSLNRTLMDSSQIHEKLAEKINEKIVAVENQPPDTIAKTIVTECDFDRFVDEIMESANPYESRLKDPFKENNYKLLDSIEIVEGLSVESSKADKGKKTTGGCSQPVNEGETVSVDNGNDTAVDILNNQNNLPNEHSEVLESIVPPPTDVLTSTDAAIITTYTTASTVTTTVTTSEASTSSVVNVTTALINSETAVASGSVPQPSDSSKNIIEEAMRCSFISPIKHNSANDQNSNDNKVSCIEDNNSHKNYEFQSNECFNNENNILNSANQNQEHYSGTSSVMLNSFPALTPGNFILTSPVGLPLNIVSPVVTKPVTVPSVPASFMNILTTAVQNTPSIVTAPVSASQVLPVISSVAISSVENGSCSSSRIFTNSSMVQPIFPAPRTIAPYPSNNPTGSDCPNRTKILLENVSWKKKSKLHVRACNKVMKKKLTKISPKPNPIDFQETICKPGTKQILPNGVTLEVLPQDTVFCTASEFVENIGKKDDIPANILQMEKCDDIDSTEVNGSDLVVIDTSLSEMLDNHVREHVTTEISEKLEKEVEKVAEQISDVVSADNQENSTKSHNQAEIEISVGDLVNVDKLGETNSVSPNNNNVGDKICHVSPNNHDINNKACSDSPNNDDISNKTCSDSLNNDDVSNKTCISSNDRKSSSLIKKDKTPGMKPGGNKRRSMSTPRRRSSHIRALDFGTPDRKPKPYKTNTSPKSASRLKSKLKLNKSIRSGLFKSPESKINSSKKSEIMEEETASKDCDVTPAVDSLSELSEKVKINSSKKSEIMEEETACKDCDVTPGVDLLSELSEKGNAISGSTEPCKDDVSITDNTAKADNTSDIAKNEQLNLLADTSSVKSPIKKNNLNSGTNSTTDTPAKICESVASPMPKLAADWDAVNGLGMIVGKNTPLKNVENKTADHSIVKKSWDAKLRSFIDPNNQITCSSPKRKHARRKIGNKNLKDVLCNDHLSEKHDIIQNEDNENFKKNTAAKNVANRKIKRNNQKKNSSVKKSRKKVVHDSSNQSRLVVPRNNKNKKLEKDFDLTDESSQSGASSDESSDESSSTIQNNDLSSELAEKIERNILSFDTQSSDKKISSEANCSSSVIIQRNSGLEKNHSNEEQNSSVEEKLINSGELIKGKYLSPEEKIFKSNKPTKPSIYQQLPILDTPIKSGIENIPPQTPILDTPMLKAIQKDTQVLLLTPNIPPTPAAAKAEVVNEKKILNNSSESNSDITPEKSCNTSTGLKDESPSEEAIGLYEEKETNTNNKKASPIESYEKLNEIIQPPKETTMKKNDCSGNENLVKTKSSKEKKKKKKREKIIKKSKNELISELLKSAEQRFFGGNSSDSPDSEKEEDLQSTNKKSVDSGKSCLSEAIEKSEKSSSLKVRTDDVIVKISSANNSVTDISVSDITSLKKPFEKPPPDPGISNEHTNNNLKFETGHSSTNSVTETLKKCDVSNRECKIPPKPKKYVKTILLSSKVSKKEFSEKQNFISQKFEVEPEKDSENEIETQRTLLNEKRQRTIDRLKQVSVPPINESNFSGSKQKEKLKVPNLCGKSKRSRKVLPINDVENSIELSNVEKKSKNESNLLSGNISKDSFDSFEPMKGCKTRLQSNYKDKLSLPGSSNVEREHDEISPVHEENAISSPPKIINSEEEPLNLPANKSQIIYLQSNEAYLHVVYDENSVKMSEKKSYEGIDSFEMTVFSGDDDNFCKINMQPLQTLLEILPRNSTNMENQRSKISAKPERKEQESLDPVKNRHKSDNYYEIKDASQHLSSLSNTKDERKRLSSLGRRRTSPSIDKNSGIFSSKSSAHGRSERVHHHYGSRSLRSGRTPGKLRDFGWRKRSPSIDKRSKSRDRRTRTRTPFRKRRDSKSRSPSPSRRHISPYLADSNFKIAKSPSRISCPSTSDFIDGPSYVNKLSKTSASPKINLIETKDIVSTSNSKKKSITRSPNRSNNSKKQMIINEVNSKLRNEEDLEEGEIVSLCGNDDNCENSEKETSLADLMDFAVSIKTSLRRNASCKSPGKLQLQTPRKRKASDDLAHGMDKKHKSDDAQRLLKNLDSEDLEQFLSAVHSETEK